jgi:hypothetical protein
MPNWTQSSITTCTQWRSPLACLDNCDNMETRPGKFKIPADSDQENFSGGPLSSDSEPTPRSSGSEIAAAATSGEF